jgi:hypothetical protein
MDLHEIANEIKLGNLINIGDTLLTKGQYEEYMSANGQSEYFNILQGVRKVLL